MRGASHAYRDLQARSEFDVGVAGHPHLGECGARSDAAITRGAERDVGEALPSNFTGVARVDMLFDSLVNADAATGAVAFEAGPAPRGLRTRVVRP